MKRCRGLIKDNVAPAKPRTLLEALLLHIMGMVCTSKEATIAYNDAHSRNSILQLHLQEQTPIVTDPPLLLSLFRYGTGNGR
jgi:hypothetical protein